MIPLLHFELVFVYCSYQIGKSVVVVPLNNFINFAQTTQNFVINSYIEAIETKLSIGKHTLRVFTGNFEEIVGKTLFGCFIFVFASICCISCHF